MKLLLRAMWLTIAVCAVVAISAQTASAATAQSSQNSTAMITEFGGVNFGPTNQPNHTSAWMNVWKTGHSPVGGFTTYRYHGWAQIKHGLDDNIDSWAANGYFTNEQWPADTHGTIARTNRVYGCTVGNRWRERGCFYFMRKGKVTYTVGGQFVVCYPKVQGWMEADSNALNGVIKWNWSSNITIWC